MVQGLKRGKKGKKPKKNDFFSKFDLHFSKNGCILWNKVRDIAQPGLARLTGGQKVRSSNLRIPTIFFALIPRQKKHEAVRLRFIAPQVRFMAQRAASYGAAVLHKSLTMKHCSAKAPQYEAASFHSAMKHSLRSYDEKMKNESFRLQ